MTRQLIVVSLLELCRRHVADRLKQAPMIEPVRPFERGVFYRFQMVPRSSRVDKFGFVQPVYRFSYGVIVGVANASDRRGNASLSQALPVANRQVLLPRSL